MDTTDSCVCVCYLSPRRVRRTHEFDAVFVKDMEDLVQEVCGVDTAAVAPTAQRDIDAVFVVILPPRGAHRRAAVLVRERLVLAQDGQSWKHKDGLNVVRPVRRMVRDARDEEKVVFLLEGLDLGFDGLAQFQGRPAHGRHGGLLGQNLAEPVVALDA